MMNHPSIFKRQGVFQFMALPTELRIKIYRFAIVEPHPLTLYAHYTDDRSDSLKGYAVHKDLGMLETCKKIRTEMEEVLYSENSFYLSIGLSTECKKEARTYQIDIRRIHNCYIYIDTRTELVTELDNDCEEDGESDLESLLETQWFMSIIATLVFKGHQLKYLLVEHTAIPDEYLARGLSPFSLLRNIHLVQFRAIRDNRFPYFRFLEGLMMGSQPQFFRDVYKSTEFDYDLLKHSNERWFVEGL